VGVVALIMAAVAALVGSAQEPPWLLLLAPTTQLLLALAATEVLEPHLALKEVTLFLAPLRQLAVGLGLVPHNRQIREVMEALAAAADTTQIPAALATLRQQAHRKAIMVETEPAVLVPQEVAVQVLLVETGKMLEAQEETELRPLFLVAA
jgi:hypothetical protein